MDLLYHMVVLDAMHKSDDRDALLANLGLTQQEAEDTARIEESRRMTTVARLVDNDEPLKSLYQALLAGKVNNPVDAIYGNTNSHPSSVRKQVPLSVT